MNQNDGIVKTKKEMNQNDHCDFGMCVQRVGSRKFGFDIRFDTEVNG